MLSQNICDAWDHSIQEQLQTTIDVNKVMKTVECKNGRMPVDFKNK